MTAHNKFGLLGDDEEGATTDRSQVEPFTVLMYSKEAGWEQHGVYSIEEEAENAKVEVGIEYKCQTAIVDTNQFLDRALRDDEPIWELGEIHPKSECDRALEVRPFSQKIGEFLDWLRVEKDLAICRHAHYEDASEMDGWVPAGVSTETLLAEFFGIDLNKVEQEKRAILERLRAKQEGGHAG